jgi:hypothetical protein
MMKLFAAVALGAALSACGGGSAAGDGRVGPCVHVHTEPVLMLTAVSHSATGAAVPRVRLDRISVDGLPLDLTSLPGVVTNVQVAGEGLVCTLPCGFSVAEGLHRFEVSAEGFKPTAVAVQAAYRTFIGGCPSSNSGATPVTVVLQPA